MDQQQYPTVDGDPQDPKVTYDQKLAHLKVVAERAASIRQELADIGKKRFGWFHAIRVFQGMGTVVNRAGGGSAYVFEDTPLDMPGSYEGDRPKVSRAWANQIQSVFVASFRSGQVKVKAPK